MNIPLKNQLAHYEKAQWTLGVLLALGLGFFFVVSYRPANSRLDDLTFQIQSREHAMNDNRVKAQDLPNLAAQVQRFESQLRFYDRQLPRQPALDQFIKDLTGISQELALKNWKFSPKTAGSRSGSLRTSHPNRFHRRFPHLRGVRPPSRGPPEAHPNQKPRRHIEKPRWNRRRRHPGRQHLLRGGMSMPAPHTVNNISKSLKTHPAKFVVLGTLMLTMLGLWLKIIFLTPADDARPANNSQAAGGSTGKDKPLLSAARKQFFEWRRQNLQPLSRNLFEIQYERFPDDSIPAASQNAQSVFWEQLAKSMDYRTDQEIARKTLVENLRKQALTLRPKAIMSVNGNQTALIDGTLASEGDLINGFRIFKIQEDRLIVEREGVRLEVLTSEN